MVKARLSKLASRILHSNDRKAIEALVKTKLTPEGEKFEFEGKTYVVKRVSDYCAKLLEYQNP